MQPEPLTLLHYQVMYREDHDRVPRRYMSPTQDGSQAVANARTLGSIHGRIVWIEVVRITTPSSLEHYLLDEENNDAEGDTQAVQGTEGRTQATESTTEGRTEPPAEA